MQHFKNKVQSKQHGSDSEGEEENAAGKKHLTQREKDEIDLEGAPTIPDNEISPAAFIFNQTEEEQ